MRLVVDSGVFSATLNRRRQPAFDEPVRRHQGHQISLAAVTVAELRYGAIIAESGAPRRNRIETAIAEATVVPVFPVDPLRHLLALVGHRPALCSDNNLRRLIESHLPYHNLEDAAIPLHIVATDLLSGREVLLSTGDAVSAVLASATTPGVLPVVSRDGLTLVDGGVANNTALSEAVALGADEVYALPAGFACALQHAPTSAPGNGRAVRGCPYEDDLTR